MSSELPGHLPLQWKERCRLAGTVSELTFVFLRVTFRDSPWAPVTSLLRVSNDNSSKSSISLLSLTDVPRYICGSGCWFGTLRDLTTTGSGVYLIFSRFWDCTRPVSVVVKRGRGRPREGVPSPDNLGVRTMLWHFISLRQEFSTMLYNYVVVKLKKKEFITEFLFFSIFPQRGQIIIYSSPLPYDYRIILSYSWSLDSRSLSVCFFKDTGEKPRDVPVWNINLLNCVFSITMNFFWVVIFVKLTSLFLNCLFF